MVSPEPNLCWCKFNPLDKRLHSAQSFLQVPDQFDAFNPKNASEKNVKNIRKISLRHLLVNLKNARVLAPPMLFGIELRRQWQPLMSSLWRSPAVRKARAPQGCSSGQELHNDQNSAIALRDANTSMRAFERFTGSTIKIGVNVRFNLRY